MMSAASSTTAIFPGRAEGNRTSTLWVMVVGTRLVKKNGSVTPPGHRFSEHGRPRAPRTAPSVHRR